MTNPPAHLQLQPAKSLERTKGRRRWPTFPAWLGSWASGCSFGTFFARQGLHGPARHCVFRCQGHLPSYCFGRSSPGAQPTRRARTRRYGIDKLVIAAELDDMAAVGVRGVRLN